MMDHTVIYAEFGLTGQMCNLPDSTITKITQIKSVNTFCTLGSPEAISVVHEE